MTRFDSALTFTISCWWRVAAARDLYDALKQAVAAERELREKLQEAKA